MQGKPAPSRYAERKGFIIVHCNVAISHCYDGCEMDIPCMSKIKVSRLGYPTEAWLRAANQPGFFETMRACFYGDLASYFSPCLPMRLEDHVLGSHFQIRFRGRLHDCQTSDLLLAVCPVIGFKMAKSGLFSNRCSAQEFQCFPCYLNK